MNLKNEHKWVSYDWANSVFAVSVISGFFPILLRKYWALNLPSEKITLLLGLTNSSISLILFFILPLTGYFLDRKIKFPQKLLFKTALIGGLLTTSMFFLPKNDTFLALALYAFSFIFFALGNTQYDSLLAKVSKSSSQKDLDRLSSLGFVFGYLGGGVCLLLQSLFILFHKPLGFSSPLTPAKISFLITGVWWILFSFPLLSLKLKNPKKNVNNNFFSETKIFLKSLNKKTIFFLIAFFLYIDVVYTTFKMAVDFGLSLGLSENHLLLILLYVQIIGAPGTLLMNKIAQKTSSTISLYFGLSCYALVIALSPFTKSIIMFGVLATFIGIAQGGLQALSRSYFSILISKNQQGIGFGFLNIFGKLSAIIGPLLIGITASIFKDTSISMLSLLPLLVFGALSLHYSSLQQKD